MSQPAIYFPFLRGRPGELGSLLALSGLARSRVRPVLDLPSAESKSGRDLENYVVGFAIDVAKSWGTADPLYIDLSRFGPDRLDLRDRHIVEQLFDAARQARLQAIPVTGPLAERGPQSLYLEAIARIAATDKRGAAIRLSHEDYSHTETLTSEIENGLRRLKAQPENVDLFLDTASIPHLRARSAREADVPALITTMVETLRTAARWPFRSIVFVGTSVPESLAPKVIGEPLIFERIEWLVWKELASRIRQPLVRFGDYAIWNSRFPDEGATGIAPARVRLPLGDHQVFYHARRNGYRELCRTALKHAGVSDLPHSIGLADLSRIAGRGPNVGNATDWVRRDTNLHIEVAMRQVETELKRLGRLGEVSAAPQRIGALVQQTFLETLEST